MDIDFFRSRYSYDPSTGIISSAIKTRGQGGSILAGTPVGYKHPRENRLIISANHKGKQRAFKAHRIAWLLMTGAWPAGEIDHIDGDGTNNRWNNLRVVTRSQQMMNRKLSPRNTSGFLGVRLCKSTGRWRALIWKNRKHYHLGYFDTKEEAHIAYRKASSELHGHYARQP